MLSWVSAPGEGGLMFATARDVTESKRMEQALRDKEHLLSESQRIAHIGSWSYDLTTGQLSWSDEMYRVYGVSPDTFVPNCESFLNLIHPDDRPAMQAWLTAAQTGEKPGELEFRIVLPDGTVRLLNCCCEAKYDAENRLICLAGTAQDITVRKTADAALQENKRLLESVIENIPTMVFMKRADDLRFTYLNKAGEELLGYSREELLGKNDYDFFTKEQADFFTAKDHEVLALGFKDIPEESIDTRKLGTRILHTKKIALYDDQGKPQYVLGIAHDITERMQAEAQMAGSIKELADFKSALDQHAIVATTDARGNITYANDKFCTISQFAREELLGQNHRIINSGHHPQAFFNELWQTLRSGRVWKGEIKNRAKDGTSYWVDTTIVPFLDENGKPVQYIAIRADITERKRMEQALVSARDEADRANSAKDSFLATMSHEIRTPLGGLMGMLELLGFTPLNKDQRETVQAAMDSGQSLLRIVNDILDWSKIEAGKLELAPQPTSIAQLVSGVLNTYARVASAKSLILGQHIDTRLSPAHLVDPLRLSQVLNNFVSNALKFTPKGRIEVRAELLEKKNGAEQVRFSVMDTGIGIAKDVQQRLFLNYSQGSADTARMYGGTGLGLSICRSLADMMEGQIELESAPGMGSTFSITLTLPVSAAPVEPLPTAPTMMDLTHMQSKVHDGAKADAPRVLVVDDHPINRRLMAIQLGILGMRAETAENGKAALAMWRDGRFDLIITDCHMPQMDGYELAQAIRKFEAEEARARTPILAWTANALAGEVERCHAAGMDELLVKPADLARLRAALSKLQIVADAAIAIPIEHEESADTQSVPIDREVLNELSEDAAEKAEILQDFMGQTRSDLADLEAALKTQDIPATVRIAHRMKGASRMVGAHELAAACMVVENSAQQGKLQGADAVTAALERLVAYLAEVASTNKVKK